MNPNSVRRLNAEIARQARMKSRANEWWHRTHCANCLAVAQQRAVLAVVQEAMTKPTTSH